MQLERSWEIGSPWENGRNQHHYGVRGGFGTLEEYTITDLWAPAKLAVRLTENHIPEEMVEEEETVKGIYGRGLQSSKELNDIVTTVVFNWFSI